ncbi:MAG: HprK-related kinase B [Pseudomonadota bacterium]
MFLLPNNLDDVAKLFIHNHKLCELSINLDINNFIINIRSNSSELLEYCQYYFSEIVIESLVVKADIEILAIERDNLEFDIDYKDWVRDGNKKGRKDSYYDFYSEINGVATGAQARILRKVRTGMVFLQSQEFLIAAGECLNNKSQLINFINTQYMNKVQNQSAVICHAAGLVYKNSAIAMAGFSGGGKSTLMLHMLHQDGSKFLSNDRLFITKDGNKTMASGIPKQPRVNPGTIVHNTKLYHLLSSSKRHEILSMPVSELWDLEEKYDVMIEQCYGVDRVQYQAEIKNFVVLNWDRKSQYAVQLVKINLQQRRDLLAAIMKSPGPFYQSSSGEMYQYQQQLDEQKYLHAFADINVYEARGGIDFHALSRLCYERFFL